MSYDEDAFMRLDSASEDSQDSEVERQDSLKSKKSSIDSDNKIMEFLLNGFAMTSKECKTCSTPLIKNVQAIPEDRGWFGVKKYEKGKPVNNVPFCVTCESIVVTSNDELQIMWHNDYKHLMAIDNAVSLDIEVVSKEDLLAVARAQERNFEDEIDEEEEEGPVRERIVKEAAPAKAAPTKYESGAGLLIITKDKDEDEPVVIAAAEEEKELEETTREDNTDNVEVKLDENPSKEKIDFDIIDYKKRRQIATKVLGAKMIKGYSLKESQCTECTMPLMERPDTHALECVVCPVLVKKVKKKMAERQMAKEKKKQDVLDRKLKQEMKANAEIALKEELQRQLQEEQGYLGELKATREAAANLDDEEQKIMDEIKKAREERIHEEKRLLAEETQRKNRVEDEERSGLIEELRIARKERETEKKRHEEEKAAAEERSTRDKVYEIKRQEERHRLIEELRVAKEQKEVEARLRIAEAQEATKRQKDSERRLALKDEEHEKTMVEFKKAQDMIKEDAKTREEELAVANQISKQAEEQLAEWRESTENENTVAENMRHAAEEKLLDAEEALVEAEELALEAQNAKDMGYGDRPRLVEMYRNAQQLRINAELDDAEARQQLEEANRRLENVDRMRRITETRLTGEFEAARGNLEETKNKSLNEARQSQQKLKAAENEMLHARFGSHDDVGVAGDDWEARRLLGKKVLARQVMSGWSVMPEYCTGRMCNFTPLISKRGAVKCVVCEGSGNGRDGMYDEVSSHDVLDDTMSFVSKRNRFSRISLAPRKESNKNNGGHGLANREVGRRMMKGWQLLESPCPECQMPLMSEAFGTPEVCIFCDPDEHIEYGDDDGDDNNDNVSVSSRQSITLEIPDGFDPSDPNAMAALVAKATSSIKGGRGQVPAPRNRIPTSIGGHQRPVSRSRGRIPAGLLPRGPRMRSQSPGPRLTPEGRNAIPSMRSGRSRGRVRRTPEAPLVITTGGQNVEDDDASQLSDDVSVARSVASHTLDAILSKIDSCKAQLNAPDDGDDATSVVQKSEAADLIRKLAAAAAAVKQLEASAE